MSRARAVALAVLLVGSALAVATPAAGHESAFAVSVDLQPAQPAAGENATVDVSMDSLFDEGENVRVDEVRIYDGTGDGAEKLDSIEPEEWVSAGGSGNWTLYAELDSVGERTLRAEIDLLSHGQERRTITRQVPVTVVDPHPSLSLSAAPVGPSGDTEMTLTVANGAAGNVTGLEIDARSADVDITESRRLVSSLAPGSSTTVSLPVADASAGEATVTAEVAYTSADGVRRHFERTLSATVEAVENPGRIELSGVRVEQQGRTVVVRGSASNPGGTNVTGVRIRTVAGEAVGPAPSRSSFFVGDVAASDYASFEVHSRLTAPVNGTVDVPVRIQYAVDGEQVSRNASVSVAVTSGGATQRPRQSGGLPAVPILVGAVALVGIVGWRRYR